MSFCKNQSDSGGAIEGRAFVERQLNRTTSSHPSSSSSPCPTNLIASTASHNRSRIAPPTIYTLTTPTSIVSTTAQTFTVLATPSALASTASSSAAPDDSLIKKSIIIGSVLGGSTILLIIALAIAYCLYKRRSKVATVPLVAGPDVHNRASGVPPGGGSFPPGPVEMHESSWPLSPEGPVFAAVPPTLRRSQESLRQIQQQIAMEDAQRLAQLRGIPAIAVHPGTPGATTKADEEGEPSAAQMRLYHDMLQGRLAAPLLPPTRSPQRLVKVIDGNEDGESGSTKQGEQASIEGGNVEAEGASDAEAGASTRASSGVFPEPPGS